MAALEILLIKQITQKFENILQVSSTSDLKLLSVYDRNHSLLISSIKISSNILTLSNIKSFAWQEDNYCVDEYRLLTIDKYNELHCYQIRIKTAEDQNIILEGKILSKWNLKKAFQQFQQIAKQLEDVSFYEILKYEAKEAVFLFDKKIVVSFFLSSSNDPQIMSISDLSEDGISHKKVLLMKETLFALDSTGTKLYIYSFSNNTKIYEFQFSDNFKHNDDIVVYDFSLNLKLDLLLFVTEKQRIYSMSLNLNSMKNNVNANPSVSSMVTAFTKQFPSVRRLNDNLRRYSVSSGLVKPICFSCDTTNLVLNNLIILENKLFFLYRNDHLSLLGIHLLDTDEPTVYKVLQHQVFFINSAPDEVTYPLLLFFDNKISLFLYGIEQDKLVNELMIYPSSGAVQALASLNNWNSIQMDIEVLRLGLSNRKIYTVEFYLKTLFEGFCQHWNAPSSEKWFEKLKKECTNWENIFNLVLENVIQNLSENVTCQYAEQLLQIIISVVIQILDVIDEKPSDEKYFLPSEKAHFLSKFSKLLLQMRKLLREQDNPVPNKTGDRHLSISSLPLNSRVFEYWKKWENVMPEDIIQESLLSGMVPLAQSYFYCCCKDTVNPSFQRFEMACENLVLYFLRQGLMSEAIRVLLNMGIDVNSKFLELFKSTPEKKIRELLESELKARELLSDADKKILKFVSLLKKLYPCTSFEHACILLAEKSSASVNETNCAAPYSEEKLTVGDFMNFDQDNSESGAYCCIVLNSVTEWNESIKSRILALHFLKNSPVLESFTKGGIDIEIDPLSMWYFLLENGTFPYLTNWIDTWLNSDERSDSSSVFKNWPLTEDMINVIPQRSTLYISEMLLNKLAGNGIFCKEELKDISLFLTRIGRSQCDINDLTIFSSKKASINFFDLMHKLVHYCLKHDLVHLLYSLLSDNYSKFPMWPSCTLCDVPLLSLTKSFYLWSLKNDDCQLAYDAVAELVQYIFKLKNHSPAELLSTVPVSLCLSVFLFKSQPLVETVNAALKNLEGSEFVVKEKFSKYPLLYDYLFKNTSERSSSDITLYELLKDNTMFDTTQLFGWQASNSLKSEDTLGEFPHFSLKSLSEQYGLKKDLNYIFFLMQGRPNYAYLKFIAQEVVQETGLSVHRIKLACNDVIDFSLANYRNPEISLACVLFIELAGQDSLPLRTSLVCANILHENMPLNDEQELNKSLHEVWKMFKMAHLSKDSAIDLISELEKITVKIWNPYKNEPDALVKDICLWMPVMTLSHLFQVEAGNLYLDECAKQDKWFKFLVFSQIFQVPKDQVIKAASKFSNSCLYYHIFHALHKKTMLCNSSSDSKNVSTKKAPTKDMRKSLYSRIGVVKGPATEAKRALLDHEDDLISISSEDTSTSSDTDIRPFVLKDLFSQLLLAHSSDVPWDFLLNTSFEIENPVLAILAASYPEAPLQSCFYMWLYTSLCHDEEIKKIESDFVQKKIINVDTDNVEDLMLFALRNKKILILWQGIQFFLPTTPLLSLLEFLKDFFVYKKFDSSIERFQNQLWDYPRNEDHHSIIHSAIWIENISVCLLKESVIACSTNYERLILLRHFSHTRLEKSFSKEVTVPPFIKICHMLQYIGDVEQDIDVQSLFLPEYDMKYKSICWGAVEKLLKQHLFYDAEMFATVAKLSLENFFLLQMNQTVDEARENINWSKLSHRISFWKPILDKLNSTIIPVKAAIEFLENQCEISDMYGEKYFLMKFIIHLLTMPDKSVPAEVKAFDLEALQKKMWWWCIKAEVNNELFPEIFDVVPMHEYDFLDISYDIENSAYIIDDEREKEALGYIINQFLLNKDLKKAFELASIFGYESHDLESIQTCFQLARGEIDVNSVNISFPDCNIEAPSSRYVRSLMLWLNSSNKVDVSSKKDIILCIEKLGRESEAVMPICHQILVHYIVAIVLNESYMNIAKEKDTLSILKQILTKKLNNDHLLAKCFIIVRDLPDKEVAIFLSEEIRRSLKVLCIFDLILIPEEQMAFSEELLYDPLRANETFQLIVKLCQDPSMLGNILMDMFSKETSDLSHKSSDETFSTSVELLICAHECFITACSMDGISQILHNSQYLINYLEEAKKFSVMVRLLTGLGRYSEMVYVFDILKTNDKLSLLFINKLQNALNLRLALMDYLKRLPSSESDGYFYTLANTFGMYREKAELLEMSVQKQLSQLCKRNLIIDMKEELENAMHCLSEAAKSYCKADCLHQAQNCTRLAQLVALQIYLLPSGIWIIGLDGPSVSRFITEHDNFSQSFIVAEHYGKDQLWSQAIMNNVVNRGDKEYLRDFQAQFHLSASLISDIMKRYQKLSFKPENTVRNMKFLLSLCPDIKVKYALALELDFRDIAAELLMGEGALYLQDLIANKVIKEM